MTITKNTKRSTKPRREVDLTDFNTFLAGLGIGVVPTIHINGPQHLGAVVTIDMGEPLSGTKLTSEQSQDLVGRLRRLTRDVLGRDGTVGVGYDHHRGIFWSHVG